MTRDKIFVSFSFCRVFSTARENSNVFVVVQGTRVVPLENNPVRNNAMTKSSAAAP